MNGWDRCWWNTDVSAVLPWWYFKHKNPAVAFLGYCRWSLFVFQDIVDSQGCLRTKSCWPHTPLSRTFLSAVLFSWKIWFSVQEYFKISYCFSNVCLLFILTVADRVDKISFESSHPLPSIFSIRNLGSCREMRFGLCTRKAFEHKGVRGTLGGRGIGDNRVKISRLSGSRTPPGGGTIITKMPER